MLTSLAEPDPAAPRVAGGGSGERAVCGILRTVRFAPHTPRGCSPILTEMAQRWRTSPQPHGLPRLPGPRQPPPCRMSWKWSPLDAAFRVRLHSLSVSVRRARTWRRWWMCGLGSGRLVWREHMDFLSPGGWEAKAPTDWLSAEAAILGEPILGPLIRA